MGFGLVIVCPIGSGCCRSKIGMRILLEDRSTGMYFVHSGKWTADPTEAYCFSSGDQVIDKAIQEGIQEGAMFYEFPDATQNFSVRVPKGLK